MSILTKPRGEKPTPSPSDQPSSLNKQSLLGILADGRAHAWKAITAALKVKAPHEIKRARQLLKGLVRQGVIQELEGRRYTQSSTLENTLPKSASTLPNLLNGVVQGYGGKLNIGGTPIAKSTGQNGDSIFVRAGDKVDYRLLSDAAPHQVQVVAITQRNERPAVGILNLRRRYPVVEPLARSFDGRMQVRDGIGAAVHGDAVRVEIIDQDRHGLIGRVIDVLPSASVVQQAIDATLESLEISTGWPEAVIRAAQKLPASVQPRQHSDREDLTALPLVTIDGITAKDFDDAVYAKALGGQKGWRLVVAIADVANYVKPKSALDIEAMERATSVYLPGQVVPMLPEAVSNELCSLKPDVFRLALVCDMQVSKKGLVRAFTFYNALIRSHARLTYEEVQAHLDDQAALPCAESDNAEVCQSIAALAGVHAAFHDAKDTRGGLDFESRDGVIDIAQGHVTGVQEVARLQSHQIIEEAMINANVCAAAFIESHDSRSLYRLHEAPDMLKLETLRQDLMSIGLRLPEGVPSSKTYQSLLREINGKKHGWLYQQLVLRSMKQAVYGPHNAGHFGLGLERYMHFTSPIRRYPDLLVHRAIKSILQDKPNRASWVPPLEQLVELGEHCSTNERRAESAGWTVEAWLKCDLVRGHLGEELPGTIAGVTEFGLFVDLDGFYVQGLLHISDLGTDYFRYDPRRQSLIGDRSGMRFTLGEPLTVVVANVEPPQGKIELQLAGASAKGRRKIGSKQTARKSPSGEKAVKQIKGKQTKSTQGKSKPSKAKQKPVTANKENAPTKAKKAVSKPVKKKKQTTPKAVKRRKRNNDG